MSKSQDSHGTRGITLCLLAAAFFGASAPFASLYSTKMDGFTLAGLLYVGAALALIPFAVRSVPTARQWQTGGPRLAAAVLFGGGIGPLLLAFGLSRVTAGTASLMLNMELVFTTVVAGLVFKEYIGRQIAVGTILVVIGSAILTWNGQAQAQWGALLIAAACLAWAVDNSVTAELDSISPAMITVVKGLIAGGVNTAIGLVRADAPAMVDVLAVLVVGAIGYGASMTLWVAGARHVGAARGQLIFATAPFLGALLAWVGFTQWPTAREVIAAGIAALGVGFVVRSGHEHEHKHEALTHTHEHSHDDDHHDHHHDNEVVGRHTHEHTHTPRVHSHHHVPDLHHRHTHERVPAGPDEKPRQRR